MTTVVNNPQAPTSDTSSSSGPMLGIIIALVLILLLGFFVWSSRNTPAGTETSPTKSTQPKSPDTSQPTSMPTTPPADNDNVINIPEQIDINLNNPDQPTSAPTSPATSPSN